MATLVTCPNGHRFPVNLKKHTNRRERYCPRCHAEVIVRKRFRFLPNPNWQREKEERASTRMMMMEKARGSRGETPIIKPLPFMNAFLASLIAKRKMEQETTTLPRIEEDKEK